MSYFVQDIAVIGQQALKAVGYLQPINYSQNAIVIQGGGKGDTFFFVDCRFGLNLSCRLGIEWLKSCKL